MAKWVLLGYSVTRTAKQWNAIHRSDLQIYAPKIKLTKNTSYWVEWTSSIQHWQKTKESMATRMLYHQSSTETYYAKILWRKLRFLQQHFYSQLRAAFVDSKFDGQIQTGSPNTVTVTHTFSNCWNTLLLSLVADSPPSITPPPPPHVWVWVCMMSFVHPPPPKKKGGGDPSGFFEEGENPLLNWETEVSLPIKMWEMEHLDF